MKKRNKIILTIALVFVLLLGASYAWFNYYQEGRNYDVIAGDIYLTLNQGTNTINLEKVFPETVEKARNHENHDNEITFTIQGINASNKDMYYEILLNQGDAIENKDRFRDSELVFDLIEVGTNNEETYLLDAVSFNELNNTKIWVDTVLKGTRSNISRTYKLRMWLSEAVTIGEGRTVTYNQDTYKDHYASVKVAVRADMNEKSLPLSLKTSDLYVENNLSYILTDVSNDYLLADAGNTLTTPDVVRMQITNPEGKIQFSYTDTNSTLHDNLESIDITHTFNVNEIQEDKIFMESKNDANVRTELKFTITKNGTIVQEFRKRVNVVGQNYCLNNGFNKLYDCILVSDNNSSSLLEAKTQISSKGTPNVNVTAPLYNDAEHSNGSETVSQQGLYAVGDNQGTSYVFRGEVSNNNVLFGGYYWKVLRTNGDGSIRLIFNGATANATGNDTAIANNANGYGATYAFNPVHPGPTYVGYMYNENATSWESNATTDYHWTEEAVYYWAAKTDFEELTDDYGTYWKLKSTANPIQRKLKVMTTDEFTNYGYTCKGTEATSTCRVLYHVHSRSGVTTSQTSYITKSPNTTDKSVVDTNNKESNAKKRLEKWYAEKLATKTNDGKSVTAYIVDNTFCNDRSIYNPYTNGSYTLNNSYNSGYLLTNHTYYAAKTRLIDATQGNKSATLLCANNNDKLSKTTTYGNAKLSYPVGLITADEFALAGGKYNEKNERFYLRTNGNYWTMSPSYFYSTSAIAVEFYVSPSGMMYYYDVSNSYGLRAVINLNKNVLITQGDGTASSPYELTIE